MTIQSPASPARGPAAPRATRPVTTFSVLTELRRQASRPRTRVTLAFMAALPLVVLAAFELGDAGDDRRAGSGAFSNIAAVATTGGLNFALFTLLVSSSFLLVVVFALFFGDSVASEASWGSLRYLLAVPVPRARLLAVKLVVSAAYSAIALVTLVGTALISGTLRYGWHPMSSNLADEISAGDGFWRLWTAAGYIGLTLLVVGAVAFLFSVSTDAPLGAVGGAVLVQILSSILNQIEALGSLRNYLPTHFSGGWIGLLSTPVQLDQAVRGAISATCFTTVLLAAAFWRFQRKDIVS